MFEKKLLALSMCLLVPFAVAIPAKEVQTFSVDMEGETINSVAEMDVENNWLAYHEFPTQKTEGVTIAADKNVGTQVFIYDEQPDVCYARRIRGKSQTLLDMQETLQVLKEQQETVKLSEAHKKVYFECTGETVDPESLGRVSHLCRDKAIYRLRHVKKAQSSGKLRKSVVCLWNCIGLSSGPKPPEIINRKSATMKPSLSLVHIKPCAG